MRKIWFICWLTSAALLLTGCGEEGPDTGHTRKYMNEGIEFEYPGNWEVTEDVQRGNLRYVFVESSGNGMVIIDIRPAEVAPEIRDFAEMLSEQKKSRGK